MKQTRTAKKKQWRNRIRILAWVILILAGAFGALALLGIVSVVMWGIP